MAAATDRRPARARGAALAGLLLATLAGCSGGPKEGFTRLPTQKVRGTVLVAGQPAAGATVLFMPVGGAGPDKPAASGIVGADGSYELLTYTTGDGVPAGEYDVAVEWRGEERIGKDRLKGKYRDADKSGLRRTVPEGGGDVEPLKLD